MNFLVRTRRVNLALMLIVFLAPVLSIAADPPIYSNKSGAIRGTDSVAYFSLQPGDKSVKGSDAHSYQWKGADWKFATAENRNLFIATPEKYAPQYGGYCAFAVSHNFTKSTKPDVWRIFDDKLYLNFNRRANKKWAKDIPGSITRGDTHWPAVLTNCEARGNCG